MAGKNKTNENMSDDSLPAETSSQNFFQQAVDADENPEGETPEEGQGVEPEFDPDHPYFREQAEGDDDPAPEPDAPEAKDIPDKENPDRFQYWQSMATKQQQKIDELLQAMNQSKGEAPEQTEPTPQEILSEKQTELKTLTIPEKPKKPDAYNASDAYTDPDSASFKYRTAMDEWNETFAETMQTRESLRSEIYDIKLQIVEEPVKKMNTQTQLSQRNQQTVDFLKEKHNFSDEEAVDFVKVMSKPESMSMDNLVKFYRHQRGVQSPNTDNNSTNRDNRSRNKREAAPPIPLGSGAGSSQTNDDEAELGIEFGRSLLSFNR